MAISTLSKFTVPLANNDNIAFPWFAPAGTRRGVIDNATSVGFINATSGAF